MDVPSAPPPTILPTPPPGVSETLQAAAGRSLQHLPEELLRAMASGLRANADSLAPGVLFRGRDSGGCAVGVTLRELAPDAFQFGHIQFWLWHRWRRGVERDVARKFPHLHELQRVFDEAVSEVEAAGLEEQAPKAVGLWLAASAETLLGAGEAPGRQRGRLENPPTRVHRRRGPRRLRGRSRAGIGEHHRADMET